MIRIAAVADLHFGPDSRGTFAPHARQLADHADVFVIAGDLTKHGSVEEARVAAEELEGVGVPTVAVLGNHDYHCDCADEVRAALEGVGIRVLDGDAVRFDIDGLTVGIAGDKGFGGGFMGAMATEFGEPEMKAFVRHTRERAERLERALRDLSAADVRIVALHYSPIESTLQGERLEIYPFLGSYLLAEAVDRVGADLVVHGHAHVGAEKGVTPGGVHVRNVAQPVIRAAFSVFTLEREPSRGNGRDDAHSELARRLYQEERIGPRV